MDPSTIPSPPPETKLHFLDYWRIIRIRKTVILAVFLLVVVTATLVTFVLPERYSSTARIKVERDQSDIASLTAMQMPLNYDPFFIQTEFEVIQSEVVLTNVIARLDLSRKWAAKFASGTPLSTSETMTMLKGWMKVSPVRNTSLIDVTYVSQDRDEAALIANTVADAYREHRLQERLRMSGGGIKSLEERFEEQEKRIRDAQTKVDRLREELKIPDTVANADMPTVLMTAETLRRIEGLRIESKYEYVRQDTVYKRLKDLVESSTNPEFIAQAIQTAAQDNLLGDLLRELTMCEQTLLIAQKDYGPEHPAVIKGISQVEDLKKKVKERVGAIMLGLETKVAALKEGLDKLEEEVKTATETDIKKATQSRPYFEAKRKLEELQRFSQAMTFKIASEKIDVQLPKTAVVTITDYAKPGLRPVQPNKPLNIALGIIIGLVVGVGLAFFIEYLDTSVKTIDDVERALQAPVLGVIPQNVGVMLDDAIESPHAEAYRVLRTNLLFSRKDEKLNTLAVVSAGAGEGKSTTVFNLAAVFAQSGQRVIVVDSDLRRPTLHKILHVTNSLGLTNYLLKQNALEEVIQTTRVPTLDFMASGKLPSSSLGILSSAQMRDLITELKRRYDFVFFDSPPIMGVSDASILASAVDMTIQVIQYRRYPQPMNIRAKQLIEKVGGNLVGIVLNNINMSQDESYYYYSGYYHEYYSHDSDAQPAADAKKESGDKTKLEIKQKY